jgi:uncharacterized membrane protein
VKRIAPVDWLRGAVMIIMALDHTREFMHAGAMTFQPEDLSQTTPVLFATRWITHFCAPVFMFTAGMGVWFKLRRDQDRRGLTRFLLSRGLWLVLLEVTVVRFAFFFNWTFEPTLLLVFWALGLSMVALAALIWLPVTAIAGVSLAMIALHNLVAPMSGAALAGMGGWGALVMVLHQPGLVWPSPPVIVSYPLVPWIGVMAGGFVFARVYEWPGAQRRRALIAGGLALTLLFVALRWTNLYGDLRPWALQDRGAIFTLLSFLNTTKYPPSLDFLLMTLGPAILLLGLIDRIAPKDSSPFLVFGRTPLFYFVAHIFAIHLMAIVWGAVEYGWQPFLLLPPPTLGTPLDQFPAGYGWSLLSTYVAWIVVVSMLYPACRWYADLKRRRRDLWWLSYL